MKILELIVESIKVLKMAEEERTQLRFLQGTDSKCYQRQQGKTLSKNNKSPGKRS